MAENTFQTYILSSLQKTNIALVILGLSIVFSPLSAKADDCHEYNQDLCLAHLDACVWHDESTCQGMPQELCESHYDKTSCQSAGTCHWVQAGRCGPRL